MCMNPNHKFSDFVKDMTISSHLIYFNSHVILKLTQNKI